MRSGTLLMCLNAGRIEFDSSREVADGLGDHAELQAASTPNDVTSCEEVRLFRELGVDSDGGWQ